MNIPIEGPDPREKVVEFKTPKRERSFQIVPRKYDDCHHRRTVLYEADRTVCCKDCDALLDAFEVLREMAHGERRCFDELDAWDAYRDSKLSERYDEIWEERRGDVTEPPTDPEMLRVWETFRSYLGGRFSGMYRLKQRLRSGPMWYGRTLDGGCVSYEFARSRLVPKAVKT